jgi:cytoskeletal protein CcmA (bactofilin family)
MTLFSKKDDYSKESQEAEKEAISSIVDAKMTIKGEISFQGKARIDGTVEGDIKGDHLILSKTGKINGDVTATSFVCHGRLEGNVTAKLITACKQSEILGSLEAGSLTVEPGAALNGEIRVAAKDLRLVDKHSKESTGQPEAGKSSTAA